MSLTDVEAVYNKNACYFFEHGDICDRSVVESLFNKYDMDTVVHFATESHVDRSIHGPEAFIKTNVMGAFPLLDIARNVWKDSDGKFRKDVLFHHVIL